MLVRIGLIGTIRRATSGAHTSTHSFGERIGPARVLARIHSFILIGIDPLLCEVEVDVSNRGLSKTLIVGLPQAAVKESIERVRRALINSGYAFPSHHLL